VGNELRDAPFVEERCLHAVAHRLQEARSPAAGCAQLPGARRQLQRDADARVEPVFPLRSVAELGRRAEPHQRRRVHALQHPINRLLACEDVERGADCLLNWFGV